jgi:glycosyltransferase involved in cell wall biosynthesis
LTASVTVLLCTYDDSSTLAAALDSALSQTLPRERFAVLVVDDGSTDGTAELLAGYRDRGVEVVRLLENQGLPAAANAGLSRIESPFFVRLDADDEFEPELLGSLLDAAERDGANFVYSDRLEVGPGGEERVVRLAPEPEVGRMVAAGKLLPTALVRELGGYRDLFWEEFDLYLRLLESGRVTTAHVPRPLYRYTVGEPGRMTAGESAVRAGWAELVACWPHDVLARYGLSDRVEGAGSPAGRR